jgi:hypothetical protein
MAIPQSPLSGPTEQVHQAAREASPWIEKGARLGYAAKGIVYGLIGVLAFMAATGSGGKATDQRGAIDIIASQPFGQVLVAALGVGLLGYALWRLLQAAFNPENKKPFKRLGYAASGIAYGSLGIAALSTLAGDRASQSNSNGNVPSGLMAQPYGPALVMAAGLVIIGIGVAALVNAAKANFERVLKTQEMSPAQHKTAMTAGRIGIAARGVAFLLTGWFLIRAGLAHNSQKAGGLDEALRALAQAPYGPWLLGLMGLGLIAYAVYMFVEARFRRMVPA